MKLSIVTFSLGRWKYLLDCAKSVAQEFDYSERNEYMHHIVFQGVRPNKEVIDELRKCGCNLHFWPENIGIGAGLNKILPECQGAHIMKMDEDCKIITFGFFEHVLFMAETFPNAVFSPFPIGLRDNLGGVKGIGHDVIEREYYDEKIYYQRRFVMHVGGLCRIAPKHLYDVFTFKNDLDPTGKISGSEDGQFSNFCNGKGVQMFYMDTHAVVEHNEGTCGQKVRYPQYFEKRQ